MKTSVMMLVIAACVAGAVVGEAKSDKAKPKGGLRYTITVAKFKNEAGWRGQWDVGDGFSTIMTDVLNQTGKFIVLGDSGMREAALTEQDFAASGRVAGGKKAPKMGRMTPAQLLVRGSVTHVQVTGGGKGKLRFKGISFGGKKAKAEVDITMYLVDSETGQVVASKKVTGSSAERGIGVGYYGSALGGLTGDLSGFKKDNVGKACEHAVAKGVKFLEEQLDDIPWEGSVVLVRGKKIIINRGEREGVEVGMKFKVGEVEELVDPDTGEVLDSDMTEVAKLEVTKVKHKVAYCKALEGGEDVKKGMSVFAAED
jgi:curli biogenesis system outer membrane secretion channel CsgG